MTEAFTAGVMIFIEQFRARWPWSIGVSESWLPMQPSSEVPASSILRIPTPRRFVLGCGRHLQEWYSDHSWRCLPQPGTKRRVEGILRMEDAGTSEEDGIGNQDSDTPIDHGHLARNCSIKIITSAVKASVISLGSIVLYPQKSNLKLHFQLNLWIFIKL